MFRDTLAHTKPEHALEVLRARICLADPNVALALHEGALAEEFGMSRTPIRQVLQRLAYERLVEIRSGVGTVASPMDPADRPRDLVTHQGIVRAILAHQPLALSLGQRGDVIALGALIEGAAMLDAPGHFELRARLLAVLSGLIADPVLKDAFLAAHWRVIRWHMRDVALDQADAFKSMQRLVSSVASYDARSSVDLFGRILADDLAP